MYKIRMAEETDFSALFPLAKAFYATTNYSKYGGIDFESTRKHYNELVKGGFILMATHDDKPVGMLGCFVTPFHLNNKLKAATEMMWYVDPDHRGSPLGRDLVVVAEQMAKLAGCTWIVMSTLATSPASAAKAYEALGYTSAERAFFKEL